MPETLWHVEEVKCGMCRRWSEQTVAPDLTSEDAHDLDGRPGEPLRSALLFQLGRCPHCFYVGSADSLSAPDSRRLRTARRGTAREQALSQAQRRSGAPDRRAHLPLPRLDRQRARRSRAGLHGRAVRRVGLR